MKYIKRFNEELSPEFLRNAAGDENTPQKKRIGNAASEAEYQDKLKNDPEFAKEVADRKAFQKELEDKRISDAEAKKKRSEDLKIKKEEALKKYPLFDGGNITIYISVLENKSYDSALSILPLDLKVYDFNINGDFNLYYNSDDSFYLEGRLCSDGQIMFSNSEEFFDKLENYNIEELSPRYRDYEKSQVSIIGFDRNTANKLVGMLNFIHETNLNVNNLTYDGNRRIGILDKDFEITFNPKDPQKNYKFILSDEDDDNYDDDGKKKDEEYFSKKLSNINKFTEEELVWTAKNESLDTYKFNHLKRFK